LSNPERFVDPTGLTVAEVNAVLNGVQAYTNGKSALSTYQQELQCAYDTASGCTISSQSLNGASQQQVQALKDLQVAGSQAGTSAYNGVTTSGGSGLFSQAFDFATSALNPTQILQDIQNLTTNVIDIFAIPKASAVSK
jgi:hypothetical protein